MGMEDKTWKYNVGDTVKVRSDLIFDHNYGHNTFVEGMEICLGKNKRIESLAHNGQYILEDGTSYYWTNEMFECSVLSNVIGCPNCGKSVSKKHNFCRHCGVKLQ